MTDAHDSVFLGNGSNGALVALLLVLGASCWIVRALPASQSNASKRGTAAASDAPSATTADVVGGGDLLVVACADAFLEICPFPACASLSHRTTTLETIAINEWARLHEARVAFGGSIAAKRLRNRADERLERGLRDVKAWLATSLTAATASPTILIIGPGNEDAPVTLTAWIRAACRDTAAFRAMNVGVRLVLLRDETI